LKSNLSDKVHSSGAVLIGKMLEVDGFYGRPVRLVTHFHSDHTKGLSESFEMARTIIGTPATIEALAALGRKPPPSKVVQLGYNSPLNIGGERVSLVYSKHVHGSAQVLVETEDGVREGYTSDFKFPGTTIMKDLDVLVLDATYGSPEMVRWFKHEIEDILADLVSSLLSQDRPVTVYAYYGKMQEIMEILRKRGVSAPFVMPRKAFELTEVLVRHGMRITDFFDESTEEAKEVLSSRWYVRFLHFNSPKYRSESPRSYEVYATGWLFDKPVRALGYEGLKYVVGFSDHADFEDTLYYVEEARPKALVIDSTRTSYHVALKFRKEIAKRFANVKVSISPRESKVRFREED